MSFNTLCGSALHFQASIRKYGLRNTRVPPGTRAPESGETFEFGDRSGGVFQMLSCSCIKQTLQNVMKKARNKNHCIQGPRMY